jgi:hypothetical protein
MQPRGTFPCASPPQPANAILYSRLFLAAVAAVSATCVRAGGETNKKPLVMEPYVVDEVKTDVLFRGTDISVMLDKDAYPVRDVDGSKWIVSINGVDRTISAKLAPVKLKMTTGLKLTETSATIAGFTKTPGYSFDNDPIVIQGRAMMRAATTNAMLQGVAQDARNLEDAIGNNALGAMATFAASDKQFGDAAMLLTAKTAGAMLHPPKPIPGSSTPPPNPLVDSTLLTDGNGLALKMARHATLVAEAQATSAMEPLGRMTSRGFDAIDVGFSISSAKPLHNPYVVTIARFHDAVAKPGTEQRMVFARALNPIDSHTSHVHFSEEGFPYEYELLDFQVHIYDRGVEIPTSLSEGRVDMTRDEAFHYIKAEYVAAHRGETRPPTPAMGKFPAALRTRLAAGDYTDTFYVKVSKDGIADASFADSSCSKEIDDPFLKSVVHGLRFKPALAKGEPTEGIAALNLNQLQI